MEEIIHAFGIDWHLIVIQMVNFGLLAVALWYFLYTPVLAILADREAKLKQGVEDAEAAGVARKSADAEKNTLIAHAHTEATEIVTRASAHAAEKAAQIAAEATAQAARALEDAKLSAEELRAKVRKESEAEVAQAAILAAEKILNERLN